MDGGRLANQRLQRLAQAVQIPVSDVRLAVEGVAALGVAVVADMAGHEGIKELERPVVQRQAQDAHVVGVEHAVAKTHGLPLRHQRGGALAHGLQERGVGVAVASSAGAAVGVVLIDDGVGQLAQRIELVARREVLEVAKADKAGRGARDHGGGFRALAVHRQR